MPIALCPAILMTRMLSVGMLPGLLLRPDLKCRRSDRDRCQCGSAGSIRDVLSDRAFKGLSVDLNR